MGALPKRRISTQRKGKRRSDARKALGLSKPSKCSNCGELKLTHRLCSKCGTY